MGYTLGKSPEEWGIGGRAYIWLATYQVRVPAGYESFALAMARAKALRDLPEEVATLETMRTRNTSAGRYSITFRRVRRNIGQEA
jgi:hypothetical protein